MVWQMLDSNDSASWHVLLWWLLLPQGPRFLPDGAGDFFDPSQGDPQLGPDFHPSVGLEPQFQNLPLPGSGFEQVFHVAGRG